MKRFITSDLHFHHKNILAYEPERLRLVCEYIAKQDLAGDYDSPKEIAETYLQAIKDQNKELIGWYLDYHDKWLVEQWNSVVSPEDTVYFLGDLTLKDSRSFIKECSEKLNGHKILIRGNHDCGKKSAYAEANWEYGHRSAYTLEENGVKIVMSHEPPFDKDLPLPPNAEWDEEGNLLDSHGHPVAQLTAWNPNDIFFFGHVHSNLSQIECHGNSYCVCADRFGGIPQDLDELIAKANETKKFYRCNLPDGTSELVEDMDEVNDRYNLWLHEHPEYEKEAE